MRTITRLGISAVALLGVAACDRVVEPVIEAPTNLTYRLEPSGDPEAPAGLILSWDPVLNARLAVYRVYSRGQDGAVYDLRGETTSTTFHDAGIPDLDYYVVGVDRSGNEGAPSDKVRVDERLRLPHPDWLASVTLNGAIHLYWSDNPFQSTPDGFKQYRIYSASYTLDDPENCGQVWTLEGTTVSPEFLASALTNGVSRCFGVSAESIEGWESLWSEVIADTPRPDARNVLIFPFQADPDRSGFRFFLDANGDGQAGPLELGIVAAGDNPNMDFWVDRDAAGDLWITPVRAGTEVALYGTAPVADLTSIDVAPVNGYARTAIQAVPGYGYVFRMSGGDSYARYGALRVTHASSQYLIFDWSYQTDPGNPELSVRGGLPTFEGIVVRPGR
ncbi:MAG: hypothetical protein HYV20_05800 [Gemmatimonadetes bacterium]|nr:hypothetical protein [Gemmatimonadota bacterium]